MDYAFYHRTDQDGKCCAAIFHRALGPDAKIIGWNYGDNYDPSDIPDGSNVYIADIHFPFDDMMALNKRCKKFVWCDHHVSSNAEAKEWEFNPLGFRSEKVAACVNLWNWMYEAVPVPYGVQLISLYDIWKHNLYTIPLNLALESYDLRYDSSIWNDVLGSPPGGLNETLFELIKEGRSIERYKNKTDADYARLMCFTANFYGLRVLALNRGMTNSKIFDSQWIEHEYDAMLTFATNDGVTWKCSLYSTRDDVDVSKVCQQLGGGGHKKAAGFIWNGAEPPVSIDD